MVIDKHQFDVLHYRYNDINKALGYEKNTLLILIIKNFFYGTNIVLFFYNLSLKLVSFLWFLLPVIRTIA